MSEQHQVEAEQAVGTRNRTVPSHRAPSLDPVLRRPSDDPTLGDGAKPATTAAWIATPTRTDRRAFDAPAIIVGSRSSDRGNGEQVAAALDQLGRRVALVAPTAAGLPIAPPVNGGAPGYPLVVYVSSVDAIDESPDVSTTRTLAAYRPSSTIVYDVGTRPQSMGAPGDVRELIENRVAASDVVLATTGDLDWLYPDDEPRDAVRRWLATGPGIVVVSSGEGSFAVNAVGVVATAATAASSNDDARASFVAAVIDALWKGALLGVGSRPDLRTLVSWSLQELVDHGTAAGRITTGSSFPTRDELQASRGVPQIDG